MGLINLLTVGRSLSGVSHGAGHYKLAPANLLPNFSAGRAATRSAAAVIAVAAPVKAPEPAPQKAPIASAPRTRAVVQPELKLTSPAPATAGAASTTDAVATKTVQAPVTAPAQASATAPAGAQSKFTLGRWVRLMLNR